MNRFVHRYMDRGLELSTEDAGVRLTLLEIFNLLKPPTAILGATVAAKVLRRRSPAGPEPLFLAQMS